MFDDTMSFDLLSHGRAAANAGEKAEAVRYLEHCLALDAASDVRMEALYWLSEVSDNPKQKRACLEEILANNLGDARARRKLALLDGKLKANEIVDPDHIPAPPPGATPDAAVRAFTCPKCGGRRVFAPDGQTLVCEYCEQQEKVANSQTHSGAGYGDDFLIAMATAKAQRKPVTTRSMHCTGCGSVFFLPPEEITHTCPYCATPYAVAQVEVRELDAPDSIIPFQSDENAARAALQAWLRKELPGGQARIASCLGIYIPVWIFDLGGQIDWSGKIYSNKRWVPISGSRVVGEDNLISPASKRLDPDFAAVYSQFDLSAIQPFDIRYLANWMAETFQISAAEASIDARSAAIERLRRNIQADEISQSLDHFLIHTSNLLVTNYRLALLPLWRAVYRFENQIYPAVVNGQTGHVLARRPKRGVSGWLDKLFE